MYKLIKSPFDNEIRFVNKQDSNHLLCIPFNPANVDFQTFKKEVLAGAELQDADGVVMTQEQADAFIKTLP